MLESRKPDHHKTSSDKAFGLVFAVVFAIIGMWFVSAPYLRIIAALLSIVFLVLAFVKPTSLHFLNKQWTKLGLLLGHIVGPLAMGVVFFLVIWPIGMLMRSRGKDILKLKKNPNIESYWISREPNSPNPQSMKQQF